MARITKYLLFIFLFGVLLSSCEEEPYQLEPDQEVLDEFNFILADKRADEVVSQLRTRLVQISRDGIAFGHQDATAYGIDWEHSGFPSQSDILNVADDYPAVIGFDIGRIERRRGENLDGVSFNLMRQLIQEAHKFGSIITISWHADNPITRNSPWDTSGDIASILPGGSNSVRLETYIDFAAEFLGSLIDEEGKPIPIIFRPWHEMNGDWFWWGDEALSPTEYKQLFEATVDMFSRKGVNNLLYCYSPNWAIDLDDYLKFYPGDEWVDVLGVDVYDFLDGDYISVAEESISTISRLGYGRNKPFAFTETGLENVVESNWWTEKLYPVLQNSGLAYTMVWRNDVDVHWFGPFMGHNSEGNFREFVAHPDILLSEDIQ